MRIRTIAIAIALALVAPALVVLTPRARADDFPAGCATLVGYGLIAQPGVVQQGDTVTLKPVKIGRWGEMAPLPASCVKGWSLSDPALARLKGDQLTIAPDAPVGTSLTVSATAAGQSVSLVLKIEAQGAASLVGYWSEIGSADCPTGDPALAELRFKGDGSFTVTWTPFETYVDYHGTYSFDPASGALTLVGEPVNFMPDDTDLSGQARITPEGVLELTGIFFGAPRGGQPGPRDCGLRFKKPG